MNAIDQAFEQLRAKKRRAFMPFITAGDPDLKATSALIKELTGAGATLIEIGFPYSDPIADGPTIQASYTTAVAANVTVAEIFRHVGENHGPGAGDRSVPLVAMVSYALLLRRGLERVIDDAKSAGFSGAIVPDLPLEESQSLAKLARERDFKLIFLVTPTTPLDRARRIAEASTGFLYLVSVTGITGERRELPAKLKSQLASLRETTEIPICVGFGISTPEHVRALRDYADGIIVGSAGLNPSNKWAAARTNRGGNWQPAHGFFGTLSGDVLVHVDGGRETAPQQFIRLLNRSFSDPMSRRLVRRDEAVLLDGSDSVELVSRQRLDPEAGDSAPTPWAQLDRVVPTPLPSLPPTPPLWWQATLTNGDRFACHVAEIESNAIVMDSSWFQGLRVRRHTIRALERPLGWAGWLRQDFSKDARGWKETRAEGDGSPLVGMGGIELATPSKSLQFTPDSPLLVGKLSLQMKDVLPTSGIRWQLQLGIDGDGAFQAIKILFGGNYNQMQHRAESDAPGRAGGSAVAQVEISRHRSG